MPDDGINPQGKPKIRGNLNDLKQWGAERMPQPRPTQGDLAALHGHDPKQLLFLSFDKNDKGDYDSPYEKADVAAMAGFAAAAGHGRQPTIYHLNSAKEGVHDPGVIIRTIREHVKKYGTLSELMIDGHGNTNQIGHSAPLSTVKFLADMTDLHRELGIKLADRIVFGGCRVFADLNNEDVLFYKDVARKLDAEIVGATSIVGGASAGRFVQFTPDLTVKRDRLDSPFGLWMHCLLMPDDAKDVQNIAKDEAWFTRELNSQHKTPRLGKPTHSVKP